ncbi:prepilin-type N-terminal cleavage/methylation domain-containing protein [Stutzerimonas stutzeri]|uniref:PilW family protein n=1 Tax=Stutzerimonas stutzeri subgroup TaxID=578833 RepID=UPI000F76D1EC|nr:MULTISPECIES: PilW family protein [Stutzerimonas stutzeri subgroup]RRV66110.1 prepilin-type N-terminal cleavage/methylation domain-containing protein [Stutzerimonas stutzeri]
MRTSQTHPQRGLSMVELLVALAISSFLLLGISQIYMDNRRTHFFQQSQTSNQENSRFAALMLNEYLGKAGFRRAPDQLVEDAFPSVSANNDCQAFAKGSPVTATTDALGICLRYQPVISEELDCQGGNTIAFDDSKAFKAPPTSSLVTLALRYTPGAELNAGTLQCKSLSATSPAYMEVLTGIADFRLEYGVGGKDLLEKKLTEGSGRFVNAEAWTENSGPIRAVRYSILFASRENQRDGDSRIYTDWYDSADATTKARLTSSDENRIYQVAHGTQTIRNLMP